jgi:enediyne biosynthesis protein E5
MSLNQHKATVVVPGLKDPRIFMACVLITYTIVGKTVLDFDHQWLQIVTSVVMSCMLDLLYNYWKTRQIVLPLSGLITGLSLALLVEAIPLWPYIVAPILAIGAKAFIRFQGRSIFNPSNFGLTVLLIAAPATVTTLAAQWSGSMLIAMIVLVIGGFTSFRVSRWDLVLSFLAGFCVMALIEELVTQDGFGFVYGPMLGAAFQVFALSMLTDPKTTPDTRRMRIVFGLAVALLDGILRLMANPNSLFIALLIISACVPLLRLATATVGTHLAPQKKYYEAEPALAQSHADEVVVARQE